MEKKKLLTVLGSISLILILALLLFASACAQPAPKTIILKIGSWMPERHPASQWMHHYVEIVTEKTGGRVQFEEYYGGALGGARDQLDNLKAGVFDIAPWIGSIDPAKTPMSDFYIQPWVPSTDLMIRQRINYEMFQLPALREEAAKWDAMQLPWQPIMADDYRLYTTDKPVKNLDELKGLKLMSAGGIGEALALAGAGVVTMPWPELYDALSKGVVDGSASALPTVMGYKIYEVVKYRTEFKIGLEHPQHFIKLSVYNKLPKDIQKILIDSSKDMWEYLAGEEVGFVKSAFEAFEANGVTVMDFPAAEQKKFEDLYVERVLESWVEKWEAKGMPAREVMDAYRAVAAKYTK